ncbi:hypothetical protein F4780DRAFT_303391 [Xylariomycetidae sp. FL0641]|nr:hypothetical protein F4780DRAFT_303391 [Xylariomycetidae sp. FL0641]
MAYLLVALPFCFWTRQPVFWQTNRQAGRVGMRRKCRLIRVENQQGTHHLVVPSHLVQYLLAMQSVFDDAPKAQSEKSASGPIGRTSAECHASALSSYDTSQYFSPSSAILRETGVGRIPFLWHLSPSRV